MKHRTPPDGIQSTETPVHRTGFLKEKKKTYDWKMSTIDYEEDA